jgi:hypothetical protein
MYRRTVLVTFLLLLLWHLLKRATATGLGFADEDTITPDDEEEDDDNDDESLSEKISEVAVDIENALELVVVVGVFVVVVVVVVEALMASKNASRTKTFGRLFADLYTATHTTSSSSSSWSSFATFSRRVGSNWRIASRWAGQDARNLSKRGGGDGDALSLLPPTENELHVKAERKTRSEIIRTVDGGVRIAAVIVPIILVIDHRVDDVVANYGSVSAGQTISRRHTKYYHYHP